MKISTRAALAAATRRARTPDPRRSRIALRVRCRPSQQRVHAHDPKSFSHKRGFMSVVVVDSKVLVGVHPIFICEREPRDLGEEPRDAALCAAKPATSAVENSRFMGMVDRPDVRVSSHEPGRAIARADVRQRARGAAHKGRRQAPLSLHYSLRASAPLA